MWDYREFLFKYSDIEFVPKLYVPFLLKRNTKLYCMPGMKILQNTRFCKFANFQCVPSVTLYFHILPAEDKQKLIKFGVVYNQAWTSNSPHVHVHVCVCFLPGYSMRKSNLQNVCKPNMVGKFMSCLSQLLQPLTHKYMYTHVHERS